MGKHLTNYDRNEIDRLLNQHASQQQIADRLGVNKSTISRELKRNSRSPRTKYGKPNSYDSDVASQKAYVRRKYAKFQGMKIVGDSELKKFIDSSLLDFQSPSAIAGRLKAGLERNSKGGLLPSTSRGAIEKYLGSVYGEHIRVEVDEFKKQYRRRRSRKPSEGLSERTFIDERPPEITQRERIGDVEMDFIVSGRGGSGYLLTVTDRKSRKSFVRKLLPVTIEDLTKLLVEVKAEFPELKSITTDNDILLAQHNLLSETLEVPIYFCHPYSSWEKGSIENLNKFVRKFIRKGSDISSYKNALIERVELLANGRFMEVLGFRTPNECLDAERGVAFEGSG